MKLFTKDYVRFQVHDDGQCIKEFTGIEQAAKALPGDEVTAEGALLQRVEHPPIVGIVHLQSKTKYGMTGRGFPIYLFEPINKAYPLMIVGCSEKGAVSNMIGLAKFESWLPGTKYPRANLTSLLGACGDPDAEAESILLRYSPWPYPKNGSLSPNYESELLKRPLIEGYTFNIDPPGCQDVDDVFTVAKCESGWSLTISITDVASAIEEGSPLDLHAKRVGQSLYPLGSEPKHMLPPSIGTDALSLGVGQLRNCISLCMKWSEDLGVLLSSEIILTKTKVDRAYTYREAQGETRGELKTLKTMACYLAKRDLLTSEEWVEALMIHYNNQIGMFLKSHSTGILRSHPQPDEEKIRRWTAIDPCLEKLAYSAATYCSSSAIDSLHWGLGLTDYTHASSPLRRYADLYNQRCLLGVIQSGDRIYPSEELCNDLNFLGKNAKSFERDMFFLQALSESPDPTVTGTVVEVTDEKLQIWVPGWNRLVRVKKDAELDGEEIRVCQKVQLSYYVQYQNARWKDKIVFKVRSFA